MKKIFCTLLLLYCCLPLMAQWQPAGDKIKTPWSEGLTPTNVLPEYPRPILEREQWKNLNGLVGLCNPTLRKQQA